MGKFLMQQVPSGIQFVLKAGNGETIAVGERYATQAACRNGIESVRLNAVTAQLEDQTIPGYETLRNPKVALYVDKAGKFRFRLHAKNGQIIAASQAYRSKASCLNGIESERKNEPEAPVVMAE